MKSIRISLFLMCAVTLLPCSVFSQAPYWFYETSWGSSGAGDGQFNRACSITLGTNDHIYVTDQMNHRIQVFRSDGTFEREWGGSGTGDGQFNSPFGIAAATNGLVYVSDLSNHRIQVFGLNGTFVNKWGGLGSGDGQFNGPFGVAVGLDGLIYVVDQSNNRIQVFQPDGTFERKWGSAGSGDGQFNAPRGIAIGTNGTVFVTDMIDNRIQVFQTNGTFVSKWGSGGDGDGQFNTPQGIAVGPDGLVYVADNANHRIQVFQSDGTFVTKWGSNGSGAGEFVNPHGVALGANGQVYAADTFNHRVQVFSRWPYSLPGLVGCWMGNSNALDMVSTNHGILVNGATYAAGKDNQAFSLDGTDDYVDLPDATAMLVSDSAGTIAAWVYPTAVGDNDMIAVFGTGLDGQGIGLGIYGTVRIYHHTGGYDWQSSTPVTPNAWTFLTYTWDATKECIYTNGVLSESRPRGSFSYVPGHARIGHGFWGDPANNFPGKIDQVMVFDQVLNQETIEVLAGRTNSAVIGCDQGLLNFTGQVYEAMTETRTIALTNAGIGRLNYTIRSHFWLSVSNASGSLATGASTQHVVRVNTFGLQPGTHYGRLEIESPSAPNSPQVVQVALTLTSPPPPTRVTAWGRTNENQCAIPAGLSNAVGIAAGHTHSLALCADGTVLAWGANGNGQCNVPADLSNAVTAVAGYDHSVALCADGTVRAWGNTEYAKCDVPAGLSNVVGVAAGGYHSLVLHADGTVQAWGLDMFGQCSVPGWLNNVVAVSAGAHHSLALRADGTVLGWGYNDDGACNAPAGLSNAVAVVAGDYHSLALCADGTVLAWGRNWNGQCNVPPGLSNVMEVAVGLGHWHSAALCADGTVRAWGDNSEAQCDVPAGMSNAVAVAAGYSHSIVLQDYDFMSVASGHGTPTPGEGTQEVPSRSGQSCSVGSPVTDGSTQYVCTGWVGTGSIPASGAGTSVAFTITNNSSIAWQWQTQYRLDTEAAGGGSVNQPDQWVDAGSNLTVIATVPNLYCFAGWTGDVQGNDNALTMTVTMDQPRLLQANFVGPCQLSANNGPFTGGNTITISNGSFGTITNVLVGGVQASIQSSGASWVTITIPATGSVGIKDIVIKTDTGDILLAGVYAVNSAGRIGVWDWSRWEEVAALPAPRSQLAVGVLNGMLYAVGGVGGGVLWTNVYGYNGTTWTEVACLPAERALLGVGVLGGRLHAFGGYSLGVLRSNMYEYDGANWIESIGLPAAHNAQAAGVLNGALYAIGGIDAGSAVRANVYRYSLSNWVEVAGLPSARFALAAGVLNGALYAVGGIDAGFSPRANVYRYNGVTWTEVAGLPAARQGAGAGVLDGALYIVGGSDGSPRTTVYRYNGTAWTETVALPAARYSLAAGVLDGSVYAVGGHDGTIDCTNVYRYPAVVGTGVSPASGLWTGGYQVVISGMNLGDGSDITNVTLCGIPATILPGQSTTQVVVTAGVSGAAGSGDVRVFSTSFGETVKPNSFTYMRDAQVPLVFAPASPQAYGTTNSLSISGGSGTGAVSYAVLSGPGLIVDGTNLTVTSGVGTISVCATKAQDDLYYAVSVTSSVAAAKADQTISSFLPANGSVFIETDVAGLSATAGSGLAVSFTAQGQATIAGGTNLSFIGAGVGSVVASQAGNADYNAAPEVTNTFTILALFDLTIQSEHETATPATGTYTYVVGTVVTNTAANPGASGSTQYLCTGWFMTGNEPVAGVTMDVVVTLTNDATLTWQWKTQYLATASAGANGSVTPTNAFWVDAGGSTVSYTAAPDSGYAVDQWYANGVSVQTGGTNLTVNGISEATDVLVTFLPQVVEPTFSPDGGSFPDGLNVTVQCATPGVTIHYTTDGNDPTTGDSVVTSGGSVFVGSTAVLKARAWCTGWIESTVKSATFEILEPRVSIISPVDGAILSSSFINVNVRAGDSDGLSEVALYSGTDLIGTTNLAAGPVSWSNDFRLVGLSSGIHILTAVAVDVLGNATTSLAVQVVYTAPPVKICWQLASGQAAFWLMNTNGTPRAVTNIYTAATPWQVKAAGDIDGDGVADLVWQLPTGQVAIWLMNANNTPRAMTNIYRVATAWQVKAAGDIDGDGVADLVWQLPTGQAAAWLMTANCTPRSVVSIYAGGISWQVRAAADINGDGLAEMFWQFPSGQVACWSINADGTIKALVHLLAQSTPWMLKGAGDIDGDGVADLIWQLPTGQVATWLMNNNLTPKSNLSIYTNTTPWQIRCAGW